MKIFLYLNFRLAVNMLQLIYASKVIPRLMTLHNFSEVKLLRKKYENSERWC
jgi:hypothetical protein